MEKFKGWFGIEKPVYLLFASGLAGASSILLILKVLQDNDLIGLGLFSFTLCISLFFYFVGRNYEKISKKAKSISDLQKSKEKWKEMGY